MVLLFILVVLVYPVFWLIYELRRFYRLRTRGFWAFREGRDNITYEERRNSSIQRLTIYGEMMYRAPHVIYVPNEEEWERKMPEWAQGRRAEILENVQQVLGTKNYEYVWS